MRQKPHGDVEVMPDTRQFRQASLFEQVAPVVSDQRLDRCDHSIELRVGNGTDAAQIVQQRGHARHRHRVRVALRSSRPQEPSCAFGREIAARKLSSCQPTAQVHHQSQVTVDRVGRVALVGQPRLETRAVGLQRPVERTTHTSGHDHLPLW